MNPRIAALLARINALQTSLQALDQTVIERGSDFTDEERTAYEADEAELARANEELPRLVAREEAIRRSRELAASLGDATDRNNGTSAGTGDATGEQGDEIYRAAADAPGFFSDIYRSRLGDREAAERLEGHRQANFEILRASGTSNLGGLVVPRYLVDKYQPLAIKRRNFLNSLVGTPAYGGQVQSASAIIPVETTAPGQGAQSAENTAFSTANWASTPLTINANTVGGYADVSVQSIQLGQIRQDRVFQEMTGRYYSDQERQALWGSGSSGECEGLFLADGTQTVDGNYEAQAFQEIYALVVEAASKIEDNDERDAQFVLMSPTRWRSLQSVCDADGRPIMGWSGSFPGNVGAYIDATGQKWFAGLRVVTSSHVKKSGEDDTRMAVYNPEAFYFEDTDPYTITADQVVIHTGTIRFVNYGFMLFSPEVRVNSLCLINNLAVPSFPAPAIS